jgi:hypothetical protein
MDQVVHVANCPLTWYLSSYLIATTVCAENGGQAGDKGADSGVAGNQG